MAEVTKKQYIELFHIAHLWEKIKERYDKKLDSITNKDTTISVSNNREIAVNISQSEGNAVTNDNGLFVPEKAKAVQHKLRFGTELQYEYDGSKDVDVPVYDGKYTIE